jgi:LysM repeat protein
MFYKLFFLFSFYVLLSSGTIAQEVTTVKKSTKIETIDGKKYYIHEIQKGETIYAVSKAYNVDKNVIAIENPDVFEKFQPGQILHIPYEKSTISTDKSSVKIHTVEKGETLYSIAKKYGVSIKELIKLNPEAENGLQIGQKLNLTAKDETKKNITTATLPSDTSKYIYHKVEKGQTMYSIAKLYDVSIDKIYQVNPQLENQGLKNGELIKIPKEKKATINEEVMLDPKVDSIKKEIIPELNYNPPKVNVDCQKYNYSSTNETFKIALLLPLQGDAITLEGEDAASVNSNFEPQPKPFLEYYEGFLLAVDSMRKTGLNISVKIIDLKKDSARTIEIINKGELNDLDLIVGPVYENNFKIVSDFALRKGINIIYPINSQNSELTNNSRVFLINSSLYSQMSQATKYLAAFNDVNYVVIHNGSQEEKDIMSIYKKILFKEYLKNFNTEKVPYHEILYSSVGLTGIENVFSKEKVNTLIIPSSNQLFVINLLTKLHPLTKKYKIVLAGMPSWKKFEKNLELEYLHNLNMHTFVPFFADYSNLAVIDMVMQYRNNFKCEPSKFSFLGFDTGIYFLYALKNYGHDFQDCLSNQKVSLVQADFNFVKVSEKGGYENNGTFILHYNQDNDVKIVNIVKDTFALPLVTPDIQIRKVKQ